MLYRLFLVVVFIIVVLLLSCSEQHQVQSHVDLSELYVNRDISAYTSYIESHHKQTRRDLDSLLEHFLLVKAQEDSEACEDIFEKLNWLCCKYEEISDLSEKTHRLRLLNGWSQSQSQLKKILDSVYIVLIFPRRGFVNNHQATGYLDSLRNLRMQYESLADSFYLGMIDFRLAETYYRLSDADSCEMYLSRCQSICNQIQFIAQKSYADLLLAKVNCEFKGDYFNAERELLAAERGFDDIGSVSEVAEVRLNRAYHFFKLYQTEKALEGFRSALDVFTQLGIVSKQAYCTSMLAESFYDNGAFDSATCYARLSLRIRHDLAVDNTNLLAEVGYSNSQLGLISQASGNWEDAKESYSIADSIFRQTDDINGLCINNMRMASLLIAQRDYLEAGKLYRLTLSSSSKFENTILALFGLAICDYYNGLVQSATNNLQQCIRQLELSRQQLPIPELKMGMLSDKVGFYHLLAGIFINQYESSGDESLLDSAFYYLERSKSQTLNDMLQADRTPKAPHEEDSLLQLISTCQTSLILQIGDSVTNRMEIQKLEDSLHALRLIESNDSAFTYDAIANKSISLKQIKPDLLEPNTVLLDYMVSDFGSCVFIVTRESTTIQKIECDRTQLEHNIKAYIECINHYPTSSKLSAKDTKIGQELFLKLVPDSLISSQGKNHIIVVASGVLHYLPFGALVDRQGQFLIENFEISYAPSVTTLRVLTERKTHPAPTGNVIAFGDPIFKDAGIDPLPFSRDEVENLVNIFNQDSVLLFLEKRATESNFRECDYGAVDYLHIATHGLSDDRRPDRSALFFSWEPNRQRCGMLHAFEIARLHIPVDMVFLSACQTGSGRSFPGEGVLSLAQPFLVAGSNSVIVSYWNINDRCSVQLVNRFYLELRRNMTKAHALATAKRHLLESERELYRHPYFWAPYVLVGYYD